MQATLVVHQPNGMISSFGLVEGTLPAEAYRVFVELMYLVELPDNFADLPPNERLRVLDEAAQVSPSHRGFQGEISDYPEVHTEVKRGGRIHRQISVR